MNKKYIIQKNEEIAFIVKNGLKKTTKYFIIYNIEREEPKFCVSVSKKIGKANIRNKIKRRIKDTIMKNKIDLNRNYVIIVRKEALGASYRELNEELIKNLKGE